MKKTSFRRTVLLMLLMGLALALSACSSGKEEAPAQTAAPSGAPSPQRSGGAYSTMRGAFLLDSGVYDVLEKRCASTYMWTVPRDVLSRAALDLTGAAGEADGDETVYTVRVSANSAYTATGMDSEVLAAAGENGNADGEDADGAGDMVTDLMGDYVTTGGGEYVRTAVWRMKDGMSSGTAEITMSLNGEESGKERFAFRISGGLLYFFDVSENVTMFDDEGEDAGEANWLITRGVIGQNSARMIEYTDYTDALPDPASLPSLPIEAEKSGVLLLEYENGRGSVTRGGETLETFSAE